MMEIEKEVDISVEQLLKWIDEAGEKMDKGGINRIAGENLWFAVCRDTLLKIAKLEEKIESLEKKVAELGETEVITKEKIEEYFEGINQRRLYFS